MDNIQLADAAVSKIVFFLKAFLMLLKVVFLLLKIKMVNWRDVLAGKVMALLWEELSLFPNTHVKVSDLAARVCRPELAKLRQKDLWGSLASQSGLIGEPQANKRAMSKEVDSSPKMTLTLSSSLHI